MASLAKAINLKTTDEGKEFMKVVYDFSVDAGATGALTIATAKQAICVHKCVMKVQTACTSGGSATVAVGIDGSGAGLAAATAVASLTGNAIIAGVPSAGGVYVGADSTIDMIIGTAALTAGKIEFEIEYTKF